MADRRRVGRFESFNAKYLPPEIVARSFIPPPQWSTLIQNAHTLLVGPRGAGKTTLLKMLTSGGITSWQHEAADEARETMAFVGVFVTADRNWSEQVNALGESLGPRDRTALGVAMFATHVLHALVETAADRIHRSGQFHPAIIDAATEADIASQCAEEWGLTKRPVVTLRGLQHALTDRIAAIAQLAEGGTPDGREQQAWLAELPALNFKHLSLQLIDRFNAACDEPHRLWCFLFDELELAPGAVVQHLTNGLRGGDPRLLFKLSLAPYTEGASLFRRALGAQEAHDFQVEQLTYPHKHEPVDFCRALLGQRLGPEFSPDDDAKILGRSLFTAEPDELGSDDTAYQPDSRQVRRFAELAAADSGFAAWLSDRGIDLEQLDELDSNRRASTVRKIPTLALLRLQYRNPDESFRETGRRRRARKTYAMFGGVPALYEMAEGNPRWFMNLIQPLVDQQVPRKRQGPHIREVVRLFRAILTAMPLPPSEALKRELGALPVLDAIGKRLSEFIIDEEFTADPPGKFRVDDNVSDEVVSDLAFALNAGGIIHMPNHGDRNEILDDLRGRTFRLAHLLAPWYPIPLTTGGRTVDLSYLLNGREPSWELSRQLELEDIEIRQDAGEVDEGEG